MSQQEYNPPLYVIAEVITTHTLLGEDFPEATYWNNEYGYVDLAQADVFTQEERNTYCLPDYGIWVRLPLILQLAQPLPQGSGQEQSPF
jgi:hypothetical protein